MNDTVIKLHIRDLQQSQKVEDKWRLHLENTSRNTTYRVCNIMGKVVNISSGVNSEIVILDDGTGKVKITRASNTPENFALLSQGMTCSVIGTLQETGKLPHISASKITCINNSVLAAMWSLEVSELKKFLCDCIVPQLIVTNSEP